MYRRPIILILTILEVGVQPCTLKAWLWFPRRISMDTGGGIWNKWQHIIAGRFQTYRLIFLSPSHYVVAVYEWLRVIRASYSLAVTVHLQMTQMQILTGGTELLWSGGGGGGGSGGGAGCEKKCEKWSPAESNLAATCFASQCQYLGQFLSLKRSSGKPGGLFFKEDSSIYYRSTCPASFIYFNRGIPSQLPCIKKIRDSPGFSLDEILLQKLLAPYTMAL